MEGSDGRFPLTLLGYDFCLIDWIRVMRRFIRPSDTTVFVQRFYFATINYATCFDLHRVETCSVVNGCKIKTFHKNCCVRRSVKTPHCINTTGLKTQYFG